MNLDEIKQAVNDGKKVYWQEPSYQVICDSKGQWLIKHANGHCIGLTWDDEVTMNGKAEDFHIEKPIFSMENVLKLGIGEQSQWKFGLITRDISRVSETEIEIDDTSDGWLSVTVTNEVFEKLLSREVSLLDLDWE